MVLAGLIVEKATGSSFALVMQREIFEPLGLKHTFFRPDKQIVGTQARGYQDVFKADGSPGTDGTPDDLTDVGPSKLGFTEAVYSDAADTAEFFEALLSGKLLKPDSLKQMLTFVDTGLQKGEKYGLGMEIEKTPWGTAVGHGGISMGYRTRVYYIPDKGITVVALGNRSYDFEQPRKLGYIDTILSKSLDTFFKEQYVLIRD